MLYLGDHQCAGLEVGGEHGEDDAEPRQHQLADTRTRQRGHEPGQGGLGLCLAPPPPPGRLYCQPAETELSVGIFGSILHT